MKKLTEEQIEKILNPDDKNFAWPETKMIMDDVRELMADLPFEVYKHLFRAVHKDKDRLIEYFLAFPNFKKYCFNHCPKCNAGENDINWGDKDWSDFSAWQNATCQKCGCEFSEYYQYSFTEIDEPV